MTTISDQELIALICDGDTKAYSQLISRYKDLVFTLCLRTLKNREEAEEVAQDVFIKMYSALKSFKGDSKFSTWIYRVTYNACLDRIKKNKKHLNDVEINDFNYNQLGVIENALGHLIEDEKKELIQQCVNALDSENAYLITLFYFEELSLEEIGEVISVNPNTVKVRLFRARQKLAVILKAALSHEELLNYGTQG